MKSTELRKLILAALMLAVGIALPQTVMRIPEIGSMLLPMHIPVLLCGYLCGVKYGALCGALTPLLCSVFFSRPPLIPTALAMCFELCVYGVVTALLHRRTGVIISLISAMIAGRITYALASLIILGVQGKAYTLAMFITGTFVKAWPGILIQLILIPIIVTAVDRLAAKKGGVIMPQVYILIGKIASGKTHYARRLRELEHAVPLSCDDLILTLFDGCLGDKHDEMTARASEFLFGQAKTLYDMGTSCSLDFGFWTPETRTAARDYFKKHSIPATFVYFDPPEQTRLERLAARNQKLKHSARREYIIDSALLTKLDNKFVPPTSDEYDILITE